MKRGLRLEQERVARLEHDVADLARDALAVAVHGDDGRVVARAEAALAHAHSDERARVAHDRLDERPVPGRGSRPA